MIEGIRKKKILVGIFLVLLGIFMPFIITIDTFKIYDTLEYSILNNDQLYFIISAVNLVILNSIRAFPHYIGAFFISESIKINSKYEFSKYIKLMTILIIIPLVYACIAIIHKNINYHFGVPAITMTLIVFLLGSREYNYVSEWKKVSLIAFIIMSFQFLDIIPFIDFLPFGGGETSKEIKLISEFLGLNRELNVIAVILFSLFLLFSLLLFLLIRDENRLIEIDELKKANIILENETKLKNLENRTYQEMRHLVHDLKSPLTSAQVLVNLVKHNCVQNKFTKEVDYLTRVENSIDNMSNMISEILNEDVKYNITIEELMNSVLANISKSKFSNKINVVNHIPNTKIKVNKITFTRSIVNILENSKEAIEGIKKGKIEVIIDKNLIDDEETVEFSIIDNGIGIKESDLDKIWESGFSTQESYGLGLSFVKRTIEKSDGEIFLFSRENEGTTVTILIKEAING